VVSEALKSGWLPYERVVLAVLFMSPLVIRAAAVDGIPLGPAAMAAMAALVVRRACADSGAGRSAQALEGAHGHRRAGDVSSGAQSPFRGCGTCAS